MTISPTGRTFNYSSYLSVLPALVAALRNNVDSVTIDLSTQQFFFPDGMAPLCALIRHLAEHKVYSDVLTPDDDRMFRYFRTAGWAAAMEGGRSDQRRLGSTYLPLSYYDTYTELNELVQQAVRVVAEADVVSSGVLDAISWTLNEVADNVLNHAGENTRGWIQLSVYPKRGEVEMVVVDNGRGIRASLAESHPVTNDVDAIELALKRGITRDTRVGQGNGLSGSVRITSAAHGFLNIHSGTGILRMSKGDMQCRTVPFHPGTVVTVTIPTTGNIDPTEALWGISPLPAFEEDYVSESGITFVVADEASGFGNRATGRALRNKLVNITQQFPEERVVIDFGGVDMVAASFTDEFIAKLAVSVGVVRFFGRFRLRGMTRFVQVTIDNVLQQRMAVAAGVSIEPTYEDDGEEGGAINLTHYDV